MNRGVIAACVVVATVAAVWVSGLRVFVVKPIGALPEGVTALVVGVPALRIIDSPDAFCVRKFGYVNLMCRAGAAGGVAENGTILARLPYSSTLDWMAGTPDTDL